MRITHTIFIFLAVISVFCWANPSVTWFDAQTFCRNKNLTLTLRRNASKNFYWTAFYKKTSLWIKIIGCYEAPSILRYTINSTELSISSPPLCQEYCLQKNNQKFAVHLNTCVCLSDGFDDNEGQLPASNCSFICDNCTLLTNECGGVSAFNVFYTDLKKLEILSHCLSLECKPNSQFRNNYCNVYLAAICNNKIQENVHKNNQVFLPWINNTKACKMKDYYPLGNIDLSDVKSACKDQENSDPRWIGVVKENYVKSDQGQIINYPESFNACLKCSFENQKSICEYVQCDKNLNSEIFCSENAIALQPETKESSITDTVVPVALVLILFGSCAVILLIYIRRKKNQPGKQTNGNFTNVLAAKDGDNSSNKTVENQMDQNYFVLQQSNPTYQLADNSNVQSESPYNEAVGGTYDRLGDKVARKKSTDDIYNHASSGGLSDLSDYDVANRKNENSEDNTYDRTAVGDDSYGKFESDLSDYT